jgi:transcriptional regulator with XRE-family HTH domain
MDSHLRKNLADNLRHERSVRHISQDELAEICDLHRTYIGGIERCERNITLSTLEKISSALDIEALELLKERK